jgi:transcription elongation factor Elf1
MKGREVMQIIQTQEGAEATVTWTCPECQATQTDSVHPRLGPYISSTCGNCGKTFNDEHLSAQDIEAWDAARNWAEEQPESN